MSDDQNGGDLINLEDIVRDLGTPAPSSSVNPLASTGPSKREPESKGKADLAAAKASTPQGASGGSVNPVDDGLVDSLLSQESPEFSAEFKDLKDSHEILPGDAEIAPLESDAEVREVVVASIRGLTLKDRLRFLRHRVVHGLQDVSQFLRDKLKAAIVYLRTDGRAAAIAGAKWTLQYIQQIFRALIERFNSLRKGFVALETRQKFAVFGAIGMTALALWIVLRMLEGQLLPPAQRPWIGAMSDIADQKFTIDASTSFEDFNDPLLHPEFIVLLERVIVNLARTPESRGVPMAMVDLFLQSDRRETSVELKDREVEVRDAVARAIEGLSYPELSQESGKAKMKLLVRRDLNNILSQGKVRRVYIKTIVLNPDET